MESDEADVELLSSLLDHDSDFEDDVAEEGKDGEDITASEIAAFLQESSDSETECIDQDGEAARTEHRTPRVVATGVDPGFGNSVAQETDDSDNKDTADSGPTCQPQHVKNLQDELVMMQKRMMEIQQILSSQSSSTSFISSPSATAKKQSQANITASGCVEGSVHITKKAADIPSPSSHPSQKHLAGRSAPNSISGSTKKSTVSGTHYDSRSPTGSSQQPSFRENGRDKMNHKDGRLKGFKKSNREQTANNGKVSGEGNDRQTGQQKGDGQPVVSTFLFDVAEDTQGGAKDRKALKSSLFGEDSDSDWEDMEGQKTALSTAGQEIKKLLVKGERQRIAHTPSYSKPSSAPTTWKGSNTSLAAQGNSTAVGKPVATTTTTTIIPARPAVRKESDDCATEKFSGIRIMNPKISSVMMASKMEGRKMIPLSRLHLKVKSPELQSDWVTMGVIVHKSDARKSQTGKTYSIWKLNDLQNTDTNVSFFLFGQVYKQLWKMNIGTVIALLNSSIMDPSEKSGGDVAFTVNNPMQVMEIGQSKDLGWCVSKTKRGTACTNVVNKKHGDFCTYHVQAAYRKQSAKRGELHGSCPGTAPKSSLKSKILQNNTFFYGGETFSSARSGVGSKDKVTLAKLQSVMTQQEHRKVTSLTMQNVPSSQGPKVAANLTSQHQQPFLDLLTVPSAGSMNLVRHLANNEQSKPVLKDLKWGAAIQSMKAGDLLKQHRQQISDEIHRRKQDKKSSCSQDSVHQGSSQSTVGAGRLGYESGRKSVECSNTDTSSCKVELGSANYRKDMSHGSGGDRESDEQTKSKRKSRDDKQCDSGKTKRSPTAATRGKGRVGGDVNGQLAASRGEGERCGGVMDRRISGGLSEDGCHVGAAGTPVSKSLMSSPQLGSSAGSGGPILGRGFYPGGKIDLSIGNSRFTPRTASSLEISKKKAIEKVQAAGGLKKSDPNAVRKPIQNKEAIRKRVMDNIENEKKKSEGQGGPGTSSEPARKRSRLLGDVDPNSEEVQRLLKARSSHTGALAQAQAEREERYFDNLEMKEKMEEKMMAVTSIEVTVFTCQQCKYTASAPSAMCKQEGHSVRKHKGRRRFFVCKKCKQRTASLQRYPTSPCRKCGEQNFEKTSMHKEKTAPKSGSETLCLRGDESKFLNSLGGKVFMSTL